MKEVKCDSCGDILDDPKELFIVTGPDPGDPMRNPLTRHFCDEKCISDFFE